MNKKRYFQMAVYVLFFVFVFGGQVLAQEEEVQSRPNPLEKVAGQETAQPLESESAMRPNNPSSMPGEQETRKGKTSEQQPQEWIIKEVNEINTGNGPGGESPATPAQQMRPAAPEQKMRPAAPEQKMRPRAPAQQMQPSAPAQ